MFKGRAQPRFTVKIHNSQNEASEASEAENGANDGNHRGVDLSLVIILRLKGRGSFVFTTRSGQMRRANATDGSVDGRDAPASVQAPVQAHIGPLALQARPVLRTHAFPVVLVIFGRFYGGTNSPVLTLDI